MKRCTYATCHTLYPVEYSGDTKEEVIENYPLYLQDFIEERLKDNLSPVTERKTKGRGGRRIGSGRPTGTTKEPKKRVSLPSDIADWIVMPDTILHLRALGIPNK